MRKWQTLQSWFRKDNLIILILAGVLLLVISIPTKGNKKTEKTTQTVQQETNHVSEQSGATYEQMQEKKLEEALARMEGVGAVKVMLTFVSSEEAVVEKEEPVERSSTVEKDSSGGSRTISEYSKGDTVIYKTASGENTPYVIKTLHPRVEGVLVVAQGAGDGTINKSITEVAQALFGVEPHRVKVVPMESGIYPKQGSYNE